LVELGKNYGTPLFVFDEESLIQTFERFCKAFETAYPKIMVCYSIKTNNNLTICKLLREKGAFAEVSSELDLVVALKAGFPNDRIIFDGPFKPRDALKRALEERILLINVESFTELERLNRIAGEMGVKQGIGLRVNPFRKSRFSTYTSLKRLIDAAYCNIDCRYGFSLEDAYEAFRRSLEWKNLSIEGIMTHPYQTATKLLPPFMRQIHEKYGAEMKYLNIGGGFDPGTARFVTGTDMVLDFLRQKIGLKSKLTYEMNVANIESVAKSIVDEIKQSLGRLREPTIVVEPGRYISASGILLVSVDHVKKAGGYKWVIVDGGTNLLPYSSGFREIRKIVVANKASKQPEEVVNIVGPLLYSEDFINLRTSIPETSEADILSIFGCGSYTISRSNQFLHPRPAVVLIDPNGEVELIREKETFEDVMRNDRIF